MNRIESLCRLCRKVLQGLAHAVPPVESLLQLHTSSALTADVSAPQLAFAALRMLQIAPNTRELRLLSGIENLLLNKVFSLCLPSTARPQSAGESGRRPQPCTVLQDVEVQWAAVECVALIYKLVSCNCTLAMHWKVVGIGEHKQSVCVGRVRQQSSGSAPSSYSQMQPSDAL